MCVLFANKLDSVIIFVSNIQHIYETRVCTSQIKNQSNAAFDVPVSIFGAAGFNISEPNLFIITEPASIMPNNNAPIAPDTIAAAGP